MYDRLGPGAYRLALAILGETSLAERVIEDAFLALWRIASSRKFEDTSAATWLARFVRGRALELAPAGAARSRSPI